MAQLARFRDGVAYDARSGTAWVRQKYSVRLRGPDGEELRDAAGHPVVRIRTKTVTFTGPHAKERAQRAKLLLRARRRSEKHGLPAPEVNPRTKPLWDAFEDFRLSRERLGKSPAYLEQITYTRDLFERALGRRCPVALTEEHLERFVAWARQNTRSKGRLISNALLIVRMVMKRAKVALPEKPVVEVPARAPKTVPLELLRRFLAELEPNSVPRVAAEIALRLGVRPAEVERLQVGDVDLERQRVLIRHHKGRAGTRSWEEWYPIPPALERVLRGYIPQVRRLRPDAPLLGVTTRRGRRKGQRATGSLERHPLGSSSLRRAFRGACERAGIKPGAEEGTGYEMRGGLHWLRHQLTTLSSGADAAVRDLAANLGHEGSRMVLGHYDESLRLERERWRARLAVQQSFAAQVPLEGYRDSDPKGASRAALP